MKQIAEVNDILGVKSFVYQNSMGGTVLVNFSSEDEQFNGPAIVQITKAWWDYETGWRFHAIPVNKALIQFLKDSKAPLNKIYVSEFDLDWSVNATEVIEKDLADQRQH